MVDLDQDNEKPDFVAGKYSPYQFFSAKEWSKFRADTPMTLTSDEVENLRSIDDPIDLNEVQHIYLALSRLLSSHVEALQHLFIQRQKFIKGARNVKTPFIIGIAGSVAVGKSTTARILQELLKRWPSSPKVDLITTDGFLYPNAVLESQGLMKRKGFPESYDIHNLIAFLSSIKAGVKKVKAPLYSHMIYDVIPNKYVTIDRPDILIFEGVNVLQVRDLPLDGKSVPFVSDFFDFSIYIDANFSDIHQWYIDRFMRLRQTAFQDPKSYFNKYTTISDQEALSLAENLWQSINLKNLMENILPTRPRADLILRKGKNHMVDYVALRKL